MIWTWWGVATERVLGQQRLAGRLGLAGIRRRVELAARLPNAPGPVLLVDDYIDSRWTMTVAAKVLREAGASAVLPFALAQRG